MKGKTTMKKAITIIIILIMAAAVVRIASRTEIEKGICLDESGNGFLFNNDPVYNYISYASTNAEPGDHLITIDILNPFNNECDDIILRYDINVTRKGGAKW